MADFLLGRLKFVWQGNWTTGHAYVKDDIVYKDGTAWVCLNGHTATANFYTDRDSTYWNKMATGVNWTGTWSNSTTYQLNSLVSYSGNVYISTADNSLNAVPGVSANWTTFAAGSLDDVLTVKGDLPYRTAITTTRLPIGTNGQILTVGSDGIPHWENNNVSGKVYYVSPEGSDTNSGTSINRAFATLRYACDTITGPATLYVKAGVYREKLPITVPAGVTIIGDGVRDTEITAKTGSASSTYVPTGSTGSTLKLVSTSGIEVGMTITGTGFSTGQTVVAVVDNATLTISGSANSTPSGTLTFTHLSTDASPVPNNLSTMFYLSDSTILQAILLTGMTGFTASGSSASDITAATIGGTYCRLNPNNVISIKSPYIKDVTCKSSGGTGVIVDGSVHASGYKSMVFWNFTCILDNGVGYWFKDGGKGELVSCFTYYCYFGYAATGGGKIRSLSGNNSYGTYGSVARGFDSTESAISGTVYGNMLTISINSGVFQVGETISNGAGATGTVTSVQTSAGTLYYKSIGGTFAQGNTITGSISNANATISTGGVTGQKGYTLVITGLSALPKAGASIEFGSGDTSAYVITTTSGSYVNSGSIITVILAQEKVVASTDATVVRVRYNFSQIRLTGHDFLSIGTGGVSTTNYPGLPSQATQQGNETLAVLPGRVYYVTTDQDGNFRVGPYFAVNQATGSATLNASAFNLSGLSSLRLGSIGAQLGAQVDEFSTDGTLSSNSTTKVPTQSAIVTYLGAVQAATNSKIAPAVDLAVDLGSPTKRFGHIYVGPGSITIGTLTLTDASGTLQVQAGSTNAPTNINSINNGTSSVVVANNGSVALTSAGNLGLTIDTSGNTIVAGNLTVNGTTTTVNSTTLTVTDKNIELAKVSSPTDVTADGAGITIKGTSDKTFNYNNTNVAFTSSEHLQTATGKAVRFGGTVNYVGFVAPSTIAASVTWTLPAADAGTAGFALVSNGSGTLSWAAAGAVITNDTTTTVLYPAMGTVATGNLTDSRVSSSKFVFNANTGSLFVNTTATQLNTGFTSQLNVNGAIVAGSNASTQGTIILQGYYGANGAITNFGTEQSSGGPSIGYGVYPSNSASGSFFSSTGVALGRGAYNISTGTHSWYAGTSQTVSIGGAVAMTNTMTLSSAGVLTTVGGFVESSSITLKENVSPITNALESILQLVGVTYDRKDGSRKNEPGLIAEEVDRVIPNMVSHGKDGNAEGIYYSKLTAYLVEAIKTLKSEIDPLKEEIRKLKGE